MLRRYHKRRAEAVAFLGGKCVLCGSVNNLEFDHIDKTTKMFDIAHCWNKPLEVFWTEVKKCQLLCDQHHNFKTIDEKGFKRAKGKHGTISTYNYCHCEQCRAAKNDYCREYRKTHPRRRTRRHGSMA